MNRNQSLNVCKGIAAISIVLIHCPLEGFPGQLLIAFARSSVALFFVISGYYALDRNLEISGEKIKKKLFRIVKMTLITYGFYIVWDIFQRYTGSGMESVYSWFRELAQPGTLFQLFVLHTDVLAGPLWFLNALICCYVVTLLTGRLFERKSGCILAIVLLGIHFVGSNLCPYVFHVEFPIDYFRNGWFYGIPFFVGGIHIRKKYEAGKLKIENRALFTGMLISSILLVIERNICGYRQLYVCNVFLLFFIFVWCINNPQKLRNRFAVALGDRYSTLVYLEHWVVIAVLEKIFRMLGFGQYRNLLALVSVLASVTVAVMTDFLMMKVFAKRS